MEWLFARRYLLSKKSHSVINLVAAVSLVAVAVPVAAMIILLSVFNGFKGLIGEMYAAVDADIEITAPYGSSSQILYSTDENIAWLTSQEGIADVSYIIERQALLEHRGRQTTAEVRGVDSRYFDVVPFGKHISLGEGVVERGDLDYILLGKGVAYTLAVYMVVGSEVELYSLGQGAVGSMLPFSGMRSCRLPVGGVFSIDRERDSGMALTSWRVADELFSCGGRADAILISLRSEASATKVCRTLREKLGDEVRVTTREEKNSIFYRIMRYEKWGVFLISFFVLVIASFSIVGAVILLIIEKSDERITLRSIGADNGFIRRIFICEGLLISGIGGLVGLVVGIGVVLAQQSLGIVKMPLGNFLIESYPVRLDMVDVAVVVAAVIAVAWLISLFATRLMIRKER